MPAEGGARAVEGIIKMKRKHGSIDARLNHPTEVQGMVARRGAAFQSGKSVSQAAISTRRSPKSLQEEFSFP